MAKAKTKESAKKEDAGLDLDWTLVRKRDKTGQGRDKGRSRPTTHTLDVPITHGRKSE